MTSIPDVIDHLVNIGAHPHLNALREHRPVLRANAQATFQALFYPRDETEVTCVERRALGFYTVLLHNIASAEAFYGLLLDEAQPEDAELGALIRELASESLLKGPYGCFPEGPLTAEDQPGPHYRISEDRRGWLGERLAGAIEHAHLLIFHPRDVRPAHMERLAEAGWSVSGIVTLSQLIAFLSFQLRLVRGLEVLRDRGTN
ncbi:CMD domain protein [Gluconacetobacter asukensis]|uniref:CMD domain protein n=1 Tax=Gluconacetobacter asukensis TaxID=1017181 RepID=A0A7W4IZB4_9PROT|nr:CMD domain protein [Gluconacetobacter asukensis]MBB2171804.1 CMD domain protein [Gluconacetobacter asukensis]